jgi:large subunit ribosomal protein L5
MKINQETLGEKIIKQFPNINKYAIPKIVKVVVNVGAGKVTEDPKYLEKIEKDFVKITGQKPIITRARKSISAFKVRSGMEIGLKTTLRGKRMNDFLNRLINIALPRIRDFKGVKKSAITSGGTINIGIKEHTAFPEIKHDQVEKVFSFQITIVTTAKNRQDTQKLLSGYGMIFEK